MDYEKAYKEALERAKQSLTYPDYPGFMRVDVIFPELAESEDERIRRKFIEALKGCGFTHFDNDFTVQEAITWLEKQGEQKPACSEEDEEMLESIITCADKDFFIRKEQINWLKSLRPQNKWKPSEEQLNAFEHFVRSIGESGYASPYSNNTRLLYSLLNDLKKAITEAKDRIDKITEVD